MGCGYMKTVCEWLIFIYIACAVVKPGESIEVWEIVNIAVLGENCVIENLVHPKPVQTVFSGYVGCCMGAYWPCEQAGLDGMSLVSAIGTIV